MITRIIKSVSVPFMFTIGLIGIIVIGTIMYIINGSETPLTLMDRYFCWLTNQKYKP